MLSPRTAALALALCLPLPGTFAMAEEEPLPSYNLRAQVEIGPAASRIAGEVAVTFSNTAAKALDSVVLVLFPNRFSEPEADLDDFTRTLLYPREDFEPGEMKILEARDGERVARVVPLVERGLPRGTFARLPIAPLRPGETRTLTIDFWTEVPLRFGSFGTVDGQLTAVGGWYPYLAALDRDGTWRRDAPPPLADFDVELRTAGALHVVLQGLEFAPGEEIRAAVRGVHYLSLVAAADLERDEIDAGESRVVYLHRKPRWFHRISLEPPPDRIMLETLRDVVVKRPSALRDAPPTLVVVEAPLRYELTARGEGAVIVSDRSLGVFRPLRPFHEVQIAAAVYAEILRPRLVRRETESDFWWLDQGVAEVLAQRFFQQARPHTRSVRDWIEIFNVFAVVDRFENAPKIPFVRAFFDGRPVADPLRTEIATFNRPAPPAGVVLSKVRQQMDPEVFDAALDRCLAADVSLRSCLIGEAGGPELERRLANWLRPYPRINYRIRSTRLNEKDLDRYRSTATVERDSSRPYPEPVEVRMKTFRGPDVDLEWKSEGSVAHLSTATEKRVYQVVVDPDHLLIEERRDDDARPPSPQLVLDSANVEVSSTEFGISGLLVGRGRYDYRKDLAFAGFFTDRSAGFTAGARYHWGTPIDATSYRHNVYAFYGFQALDRGFKEKGSAERTDGQLGSLGLRYDYTNVFWYDDPSHQRSLRLFADWYDDALGGDFDYVDWGFTLTGTQPLGSHRTTGALHVLNGFSEPLGDSRIPNQGLYSLGGSLSIRGIGAEEELGENIFVLRAELRQDVYPEVDLNFLDLFVLRRGQLRLFVDTGRVNDVAGRVYNPSQYAAGVGIGLSAFYDFMGFFPASAYIEIATRVDEPSQADEVQVLFGTRQAF